MVREYVPDGMRAARIRSLKCSVRPSGEGTSGGSGISVSRGVTGRRQDAHAKYGTHVIVSRRAPFVTQEVRLTGGRVTM
ncbi:hypothetical protein Pve01_12400 [Planomonospora venezuelensis]|nr:hypothetical protein Pve01_12400 [Planomonospora venezuelensis]